MAWPNSSKTGVACLKLRKPDLKRVLPQISSAVGSPGVAGREPVSETTHCNARPLCVGKASWFLIPGPDPAGSSPPLGFTAGTHSGREIDRGA